MKKIAFIIFTLLISFNAKAEIESRELLDEIFYGCASDDEDWLTTGELYEYCGCTTNVISKVLSIEDILRLCLLYTSPSPRDMRRSRMPSSA